MDEMDSPAYFGEWLKRRRKALDLTRAELAQRAGCSVSTLRKIESGERRPSKQLAGLLADSLEIPTEDKPAFIRIARGELSIEQAQFVVPLPDTSALQAPPLPIPPAKLPVHTTPFIGRQAELATVGQLLQDPECRLLTLVGPGGIGKTRLAIQVGIDHQGQFTHGVFFIGLASLGSSAFLIPTIARTLDLAIDSANDPGDQLISYLRQKHMLLILDNVEHLLDGSLLFSEIIRHAPQVKLLITSREVLNLHGEWVIDVRGLALPQSPETEDFDASSAVSLFLQRAHQMDYHFALQPEEHSYVAVICRLVEGMPLAIEMAASWVNALSPREIAEEIEHSLDILSTSIVDIPERHRSMRAVFDHSWNMLSEEEGHVLSQLSVFQGGFTRQAAEFVAGASLSLLGSLVLRSLVQRTSEGRYDMHELIRQYSADKLAAAGEMQPSRDRHLDFFLDIAQTAQAGLSGSEGAKWLEGLESEWDNLRKALNWAIERGAVEHAQRLCAALVQFWLVRGYLREGRYWVEAALEQSNETPAAVQASALSAAGRLAMEQRDLDAAEAYLQTSLALHREMDDQTGAAAVLNSLGSVEWYRGDLQKANALYEQVLALRREGNDRQGVAIALNNLGLVAMGLQEFARAERIMEESASLARELGNKQGLANTLFNLGLVTVRMEGGAQRAVGYFTDSLALSQDLGYRKTAAYALNNLAMLALHRGDASHAEALALESFSQCHEMEDQLGVFFALINLGDARLALGDLNQANQHLDGALEYIQQMHRGGASIYQVQEGVAWLLEAAARLAAAQGQPTRALRLAGAASVLLEDYDKTFPPTAQAYAAQTLEAARSRLGETVATSAWKDGTALLLQGDDPFEAAIAEILNTD